MAIAGILALGGTLMSQNGKTEDKNPLNKEIKPSMSASAFEYKTNMRKLWEDHITWTRNVTFCIIDELPGTALAVARLQKNQDDIGNALIPYYGEISSKKFADLLHVHISTAADVLKATKTDNQTALADANKKWFANADEISQFLSNANPNFKREEMKMMMDDHLKLTTEVAIARKKKDYEGDVKAYDKVHLQILKMSDVISDGIIKQFPDKFKNGDSMGANQ